MEENVSVVYHIVIIALVQNALIALIDGNLIHLLNVGVYNNILNIMGVA